MSKKRKTKKEKQLASQRRNYTLQISSSPTTLPSINVPEIKPVVPVNSTTHAHNYYPYVVSDVQKTMIVTAALMAADLIIYFILKSKILVIPGVGF